MMLEELDKDSLIVEILDICNKVLDVQPFFNDITGEKYCPFCTGEGVAEDLKLMEHDDDCVWKQCEDIRYKP